ncbi:MAG: glycosyl hydrolase [Planctomycetota bacterium]
MSYAPLLALVLSLPLASQEAAPATPADDPETSAEATEEEEEDEALLSAGTLSAFSFRSIGPALMSGRIADIAVDPAKPNIWYVAVGSGGIWKTVNAGTTWTPIFDDQKSYSIGCVTLDPNNRHTLWVGTGEAVGGRHVGWGDGVYRSRDGGATFEHLGLEDTEHIAKIVVDPRDSDVVFVASQGPLWSEGGERGLYVTRDGGASWGPVLTAGPWTGVTDVVLDPRNPDVMLAATHQRHRTVAALMNGGPESGIHKSTDGGRTWRKLKRGLPGGDLGKIALAVSPQRPDVVYATIELAGREGGFWRSTDGGESWDKRSDYVSGGTGPHYYQELWADPHRFDVLYQANVRLGRTEDGGETWDYVGNGNKHVDNHAVAFHPTDPDVVIAGCDGGIYRSYDYCGTWSYAANLPLTQFYKLDVDYDWPVYHVVGGTQDNNTQYGPARTLHEQGVSNRDWRITIGGDGHDNAIDPQDPNIIYCESQQGYLRRFDRSTGESVGIRPQPGAGEETFRFNWDSPILISPHSHTRLYFGSKKLFRSDDRGDSWTAISGDLSRDVDRLTMPMMGRVWSIDAFWDLYAMSRYGNITSISESPVVEGLIYVGTDDGLLQVTEDGGANWRSIDYPDGIPDGSFVNDVKADLHDANTVYAAYDNHKQGDYAPYVLRSTDRGRTWTSIVSDLPEENLIWRIEQDHVKQELLFLGTEFGIYASVDGGAAWLKLKGGLPNISFRDLAVQRRENDLVGASFGRGFYVLDDYSPLRELSEEGLAAAEVQLYAPRTALLYIEDDELGGRRGSQGDAFYVADNPPYGAVMTVWLRDDLQSAAGARKKAEKEIAKEGGDTPYPGFEALKAEERESEPALLIEIRDAAGAVVNRIDGPSSKGLHRIAWNLRYAPFTAEGRMGPLVTPGRYSAQAFLRRAGVSTAAGAPVEFDVQAIGEPTLPRVDRAATLAFQRELGDFQRGVVGAQRVLSDALADVRAVSGLGSLELALLDEAEALERQLQELQDALTGNPLPGRYNAESVPSITGRLQTALWGTLNQTHGPTATMREQMAIAKSEYEALEPLLRSTLEVAVPEFLSKVNATGAPYTRGRDIPSVR